MRSGVVGLLPGELVEVTPAAARRVREHGFTGMTVMLGHPGSHPRAVLREVSETLAGEGIAVAQANGTYPSLIHPDPEARVRAVEGLKHHVQAAGVLAAETLYIRPGSLNPAGPWYPHPEHHGEAVFERAVSSIAAVAAVAEAEGVVLAVEGHVLSVFDRPERMEALLDQIPVDSLSINLDPVNFVGSIWDAWNPDGLYDRLLSAVGARTKVAHWKDYRVEDKHVLHITEVPIGDGVIDHAAWLAALSAVSPDAWVLIEHLPPSRIPAAKMMLDRAMEVAGLSWDIS